MEGYPTKEWCEKRVNMIKIQVDRIIKDRDSANNYLRKLEKEKEFLCWIINEGDFDVKRD